MTEPVNSRALRKRLVLAGSLVMLLSLCLLAAACGGSAASGDDTHATVIACRRWTRGPGQAVTDTWAQTMQQLVAILEDKPEVSSATPQVEALKESTIQTLIGLGRHRETLSAADRARADSLEWSTFYALTEESWYPAYHELWQYYQGLDLEFANLISGFNILTQYSDFTLLRQQLPDEAVRLGVD